jgi:hypothetical protein
VSPYYPKTNQQQMKSSLSEGKIKVEEKMMENDGK